jgi:mono/diheme cytochrome c family protein
MRNRLSGSILALLIATACDEPISRAAELNGPMSSGKRTDNPAATAPTESAAKGLRPAFDVEKLFANTCGWCHSDAGRAPGRGPQLMGTKLTDAEIVQRIKVGKAGAMPAFASAFSSDEIQAIVAYIRGLRPDGAAK